MPSEGAPKPKDWALPGPGLYEIVFGQPPPDDEVPEWTEDTALSGPELDEIVNRLQKEKDIIITDADLGLAGRVVTIVGTNELLTLYQKD
jgi:hypothetical protein